MDNAATQTTTERIHLHLCSTECENVCNVASWFIIYHYFVPPRSLLLLSISRGRTPIPSIELALPLLILRCFWSARLCFSAL